MLTLLLACATTRAPVTPPVDPTTPWHARLDTTEGEVLLLVHPEWAPRAAARFGELVEADAYSGARIYRVVPGFVAQWGLAADPKVTATWQARPIRDELPRTNNRRGTVTFAASGAPDSRSLQVFVNLADNRHLDRSGFAPFAEVIAGMDVVDRWYSGYGEGAPMGTGPDQPTAMMQGEAYFARAFPELDQIRDVERAAPPPTP